MSLIGGMERTLWLEGEVERLRQENKRLLDAIEAHERAVCDNPKAAGQEADERLWSVLHPGKDGA